MMKNKEIVEILKCKNTIRKTQIRILQEKQDVLEDQKKKILESITKTEDEIRRIENCPEKIEINQSKTETKSVPIIPSEVSYWNLIPPGMQKQLINHEITLNDVPDTIKHLRN